MRSLDLAHAPTEPVTTVSFGPGFSGEILASVCPINPPWVINSGYQKWMEIRKTTIRENLVSEEIQRWHQLSSNAKMLWNENGTLTPSPPTFRQSTDIPKQLTTAFRQLTTPSTPATPKVDQSAPLPGASLLHLFTSLCILLARKIIKCCSHQRVLWDQCWRQQIPDPIWWNH